MLLCTNLVFYKPLVYLVMEFRDKSETLIKLLKIQFTVTFTYPFVSVQIKITKSMLNYKLICKVTVSSCINNIQVVAADTMYKYSKINHIPALLQELPVKQRDFV